MRPCLGTPLWPSPENAPTDRDRSFCSAVGNRRRMGTPSRVVVRNDASAAILWASPLNRKGGGGTREPSTRLPRGSHSASAGPQAVRYDALR